jgi:hypothetical protein
MGNGTFPDWAMRNERAALSVGRTFGSRVAPYEYGGLVFFSSEVPSDEAMKRCLERLARESTDREGVIVASPGYRKDYVKDCNITDIKPGFLGCKMMKARDAITLRVAFFAEQSANCEIKSTRKLPTRWIASCEADHSYL